MGRMRLLDKVFNASASQVEGFCIVKSVGIKTNVKGAAYLDMILADAGGECARLIRSEHGHKGARHDKHVERRGAA